MRAPSATWSARICGKTSAFWATWAVCVRSLVASPVAVGLGRGFFGAAGLAAAGLAEAVFDLAMRCDWRLSRVSGKRGGFGRFGGNSRLLAALGRAEL